MSTLLVNPINPYSGDTITISGSNISIGNTLFSPTNNIFVSSSLTPFIGAGSGITSSFNLGSPTAAWKELYISTGSINFVEDNGTITKFTKQDVADLKAGKSIATDSDKKFVNSVDDTTYMRMGTSGKVWTYISGSPVMKLGVGAINIGDSTTTTTFGSAGITGGMIVTGSTVTSGSCIITGSTEMSGSCTVTGDVNLDGEVTVTDLLTLLGNYGQTGSFSVSGSSSLDGDLNCDGQVTITDLLTLLDGFGASGSCTITGSVEITGSITCDGTVVETFPNSIVISGSRSLTLETHAFKQIRIASGAYMDSINDPDNFMASHSAYAGGTGSSNTLTLTLPSIDCGHAYNIVNTFWPGQGGTYMGTNSFGAQPTFVIEPSGSNKFIYGPGGVAMGPGDKLIYHSSSYYTEAAYGTGVNITSVSSGSAGALVWALTQVNGSWISGSSPLD